MSVLRAARQVATMISGTPRAALTAGGWLKGETILPELIRKNHDEYTRALIAADKSLADGKFDMSVLHAFVSRLLNEQLQSASPPDSQVTESGQ